MRALARLLAVLLLLTCPAYADNYSGGGGGGSGSGVSITCPPGGPFTTLNNIQNIITATGTTTLSTCGAIYKFTTSGATTANLPAPSNGFYLTGITNVPSSTNAVTVTPPSGQICAATCAATYSLAAGTSIGLYSDGTNYYVQYAPSSAATPIITGPGYATGLWYIDPYIVNTATGTTAQAATTAYCTPLSIYNLTATTNGTGTIGTVAIQVTTLAAGGNTQVALYNNATGNRPGTLVANTASISDAATGSITGSITANVAPGFYWWCSQSDNTTVRFTTAGTNLQVSGRAGAANSGNIAGAIAAGFSTTTGITSFGTWPNLTSAVWSGTGNIEPIVQFNFSTINP